jgi:hypothetical protein
MMLGPALIDLSEPRQPVSKVAGKADPDFAIDFFIEGKLGARK